MKKMIVAISCVAYGTCFAMQDGHSNSEVDERFFLVKRLDKVQEEGSLSKAMKACIKLKKYEDDNYYPCELKERCDAIQKQYVALLEKK